MHILIFEPRTRGHHLIWLRYITEDFLSAGFKVSIAADCRQREQIRNQLSGLTNDTALISVFDERGKFIRGSRLKTIAHCFRESGAQEIFMPNFDEIASHCLRLAAVGIYPPEILKGRLSGVYFRPRFLKGSSLHLGNIIKAMGLRHLCRNRWFKKIYLLDEYLFPDIVRQYSSEVFYFLPDPWSGIFSHRKRDARQSLGISSDKFVFLFYGIGDKRKGLHLVIEAMHHLHAESRLFLLCAGQIAENRKFIKGLESLEQRNSAKIMNRYVSAQEEELCFCASDVVLVPYIGHFGSSGILPRATAAGKMVISSDEGLVAKRISEHHLGWLFPSGDIIKLKECMTKASLLSDSDMQTFRESALRYARSCSREAFRTALLSPYQENDERHI